MSTSDASEPCDVLLVRLSALGDVVHALGAVRALAVARPQWRLHFVVQREFAPVLADFPGLHAVVTHERRPAVRGFVRGIRGLRALRFALALDLQGNWKSALVARVSGAPRRVGIAPPWRREPRSACLLTERVSASAAVPHPARLAYDVVRAVAHGAPEVSWGLHATMAEVEHEAAALRALGVDPTRPFVVLILGDPADNRSWPAAFAARAAAATPYPAFVLAGPKEPRELPLPPGVPLLRHAHGELRRLVALGTLLARTKGHAIGPDQGPTHVLAACGADVVALFGPQDPSRTAPLRAQVMVHRQPPPCMPCRARVCTHVAGPVCMHFTPQEGVAR
jgi:ADP-heptose:LPS heptosyltransferase